MAILLVVSILAVAAILLAVWIVRLQRKSREIEKTLDYSRMREWRDDDD